MEPCDRNKSQNWQHGKPDRPLSNLWRFQQTHRWKLFHCKAVFASNQKICTIFAEILSTHLTRAEPRRMTLICGAISACHFEARLLVPVSNLRHKRRLHILAFNLLRPRCQNDAAIAPAVERTLGKGEVACSNHAGSTIISIFISMLRSYLFWLCICIFAGFDTFIHL